MRAAATAEHSEFKKRTEDRANWVERRRRLFVTDILGGGVAASAAGSLACQPRSSRLGDERGLEGMPIELRRVDDDHYEVAGWPERVTPTLSRVGQQRWQIWLGRTGPHYDDVIGRSYPTLDAALAVLRSYHRPQLEIVVLWDREEWSVRVEDPRESTVTHHASRAEAFSQAESRLRWLYPRHDCGRARCESWQPFVDQTS